MGEAGLKPSAPTKAKWGVSVPDLSMYDHWLSTKGTSARMKYLPIPSPSTDRLESGENGATPEVGRLCQRWQLVGAGFETRPYELKWQRSQDELVITSSFSGNGVMDSRLRGNDGGEFAGTTGVRLAGVTVDVNPPQRCINRSKEESCRSWTRTRPMCQSATRACTGGR